jgi:hypothetical protein
LTGCPLTPTYVAGFHGLPGGEYLGAANPTRTEKMRAE